MFPHAREVLGDRALLALGERMAKRRAELRTSGPLPRTSGVHPVARR